TGELVGERRHVLLLLQERAEEWELLLELDLGDASLLEDGNPVDELARGRALAEAGVRRISKKTRSVWSTSVPERSGWCTATMRRMNAWSGKSMKWNTHRRRNASGSSFSLLLVMITTGRSAATISSPVSVTRKRMRSSSWRRSLGNSRSALSISSMSRTTRFGALRAWPSGPSLM